MFDTRMFSSPNVENHGLQSLPLFLLATFTVTDSKGVVFLCGSEEARQHDSGVCWADVRTVEPSRPITRSGRMIVWPVVPRLLVQLSNELPYLDHKSGGRGGRVRSGRDHISHYIFFF